MAVMLCLDPWSELTALSPVTGRVVTKLEKPGNLEYSEPGKLMEFSGNSVQPDGKIMTNEIILIRLNICVKQLLTG